MQDKIIEEIKINNVLKHRTIFMTDVVDSESMFKFCYYLDRIKRQDIQNGVKKEDLKPITIIYNSFGGSIYDGLGAISKLESMMNYGYTIISQIQSYAMSMGNALALVATKRIAGIHSRIMIHQPSSSTWGKLQDMEDDVEETLKLWERMKTIITKYSKVTNEQLEEIKKTRRDWYMWSEEALKLGIIDEIL